MNGTTRILGLIILPLAAACSGGGPGTSSVTTTPPPSAPPPGELESVFAGGNHTCAVRNDGQLLCWGDNASGQLGTASATGALRPEPVSQSALQFAFASLGARHTCAARAVAIRCWGEGLQGQLGDGSQVGSNVPISPKSPFAETPLSYISAMATGNAHTCATNGTHVYCWGANDRGQLGTAAPMLSTVPLQVARPADAYPYADWAWVAAGHSHTCAVLEDNNAWCWGANDRGQLGTGSIATSASPSLVPGLRVTDITAGASHTCGLVADPAGPFDGAHPVACWGANDKRQLSADGPDSPTPVRIASPRMRMIRAGAHHTCGITVAGEVACWGDNAHGQLGDGSTTSAPGRVTLIVPPASELFTAVAAGDAHTCALTSRHRVYCWGANNSGQLGNGTKVESHVPVLVTTD